MFRFDCTFSNFNCTKRVQLHTILIIFATETMNIITHKTHQKQINLYGKNASKTALTNVTESTKRNSFSIAEI